MKVTGPVRENDFIDTAYGEIIRATNALTEAQSAISRSIALRQARQTEPRQQASSCREFGLEDYLEQLVQSASWLITSGHFSYSGLTNYMEHRLDYQGNVRPLIDTKE